jgi:DoxX-like family
MAEVAAIANSVGTKPPGKVFNIILWVLQIAAAAMFLFAGAPKLLGAPQVVAVFETIGFGQWFRYLTGGLEVLCAILLLHTKFERTGRAALNVRDGGGGGHTSIPHRRQPRPGNCAASRHGSDRLGAA